MNPTLQVGQSWLICPPNTNRVAKVFITDVTEMTVEYQEVGGGDELPVCRYKKHDVELVELLAE